MARSVAVGRCTGLRPVRAQGYRSSKALNTGPQRQDAAVPFVTLVRVLPLPVWFGEYPVVSGRCGVGGGNVAVLLLGHERGQQAGAGSQAKSCAGRRRRGHTTAGDGVLGLASETTKDAVGHCGRREAEAPPNRSGRSKSGGAHGRPAHACKDDSAQGGASRLQTRRADNEYCSVRPFW